MFIDESGFTYDMPRTHGYSLKGVRCYGHHEFRSWNRTNVIGALVGFTLLTVSLFHSTINMKIFTAWVKEDLIPKLPSSSVVIMDNATFHKGQDMKKALLEAGHCLLYLPPYSPDLNPIEHKWAQAKALRRKNNCKIEELFTNLNL